MSRDRGDYTAQRAALDDAREALSETLNDLAAQAKLAARTVRRGDGEELALVYSLVATVQSREEAVDIATYDLETAMGEDG